MAKKKRDPFYLNTTEKGDVKTQEAFTDALGKLYLLLKKFQDKDKELNKEKIANLKAEEKEKEDMHKAIIEALTLPKKEKEKKEKKEKKSQKKEKNVFQKILEAPLELVSFSVGFVDGALNKLFGEKKKPEPPKPVQQTIEPKQPEAPKPVEQKQQEIPKEEVVEPTPSAAATKSTATQVSQTPITGGTPKQTGVMPQKPTVSQIQKPTTPLQKPATATRPNVTKEIPSALKESKTTNFVLVTPIKNDIKEIIEVGPGYNIVKRPDGKIEKQMGARNWRNNNPGNIDYGDFAKSNGAIGTDGRFAIFPNYETGRRAKEKLIFEGKNYKSLDLKSAIARYAPESENNTKAYQAKVLSAVDGQNKIMASYTPNERVKILNAMQQQEGYKVGQVYAIKETPGNVPSQTSTGTQLASVSTQNTDLKKTMPKQQVAVLNTTNNNILRPPSQSTTIVSSGKPKESSLELQQRT